MQCGLLYWDLELLNYQVRTPKTAKSKIEDSKGRFSISPICISSSLLMLMRLGGTTIRVIMGVTTHASLRQIWQKPHGAHRPMPYCVRTWFNFGCKKIDLQTQFVRTAQYHAVARVRGHGLTIHIECVPWMRLFVIGPSPSNIGSSIEANIKILSSKSSHIMVATADWRCHKGNRIHYRVTLLSPRLQLRVATHFCSTRNRRPWSQI